VIPISEIFGPTIQGEGTLIGKPTVFVRTGGCDYRCAWCDTLYAVLPEHKAEWLPMENAAIIERVFELTGGAPILVTLSGGNPALHDLSELLDLGHARGLTFAMETQASVARPWFAKLDHIVLSPKGPSSGMETNWSKVEECLTAAAGVPATMKIVVFDEADYAYAKEARERFQEILFTLQAGTLQGAAPGQIRDGVEWLLGRCKQDAWLDVTILPQLHVLLWGQKRGV
jgi:7-carboxy-7-deazaguanine synthase